MIHTQTELSKWGTEHPATRFRELITRGNEKVIFLRVRKDLNHLKTTQNLTRQNDLELIFEVKMTNQRL